MDNDDLAAAEQLAHAGQSALMRAILNGSFDFSHAPQFPRYKRNESTRPVNVRSPIELVDHVLKYVGNDRKYRDLTQAVNSALGMFVQYESTADEQAPDPLLVKLNMEERLGRRKTTADALQLFNEAMNEPGLNDIAREAFFSNLRQLRLAALADGNDDQVEQIDQQLKRGLRLQHYDNARRTVDGLSDS